MGKRHAYSNPSASKAKSGSGSVKDRNLAAVNPLKQQFEPTPASPVRQHYKMAGGS
jgi:hypothetical protein